MVKTRGALWQYIFEHSNHPRPIIGSWRTPYSSYFYNFFHWRMAGWLNNFLIALWFGHWCMISAVWKVGFIWWQQWVEASCFLMVSGTPSNRIRGKEAARGWWNHKKIRDKAISRTQIIHCLYGGLGDIHLLIYCDDSFLYVLNLMIVIKKMQKIFQKYRKIAWL